MKKIISVALSIMIIASVFTTGTTVSAEAGKVKISYSVFNEVYVMEPSELEVYSSLSDEYQSVTGFNDNSNSPTILDATIAAHIATFGKDFSDYAPLKCENGWISEAFGETTSFATYRLNGKTNENDNYYTLTSELEDEDSIEFMFYKDRLSSTDIYTSFDKRILTAKESEKITLKLTGEGYDANYNVVNFSTKGLEVTVNDNVVGIINDNNEITLSFDKEGIYKISAQGLCDSRYIFAPFCLVTVEKNPLADYIESQIKGAADYLCLSQTSFDCKSAIDFLTLLNSGKDMSAYKENFLSSVKENLNDNVGKLKIDGKESPALYGAVISILKNISENPLDFNGCNLVKVFSECDVTTVLSSPYYYRVAIEAAVENNLENGFVKSLINGLLSLYKMGSGMNYWGFSCDNTANFIASLASFKTDYSEQITDALKLIDSYKTNKGYFYNPAYGKLPNTNSTAAALMALSSVGETEKASNAYKMLTTNFESNKTGIFNYDGKANMYATKDSLLALEYFLKVVKSEGINFHVEGQRVSVKPATYFETGYTGDVYCKVSGELISKGQVVAKIALKTPSSLKLTAVITSIKVSFSKVAGATSYEIYRSDKKDSGYKLLKTVTSNSFTDNNIILKKNYYYKVRAIVKSGSRKAVSVLSGYKNTKTTNLKTPKFTYTEKKKAFSVKYNKVSSATGFQVKYKKSGSSKWATKTYKTSKTAVKNISKLKKGKYSVKSRAYSKGAVKTAYSDWTKTKIVKVK